MNIYLMVKTHQITGLKYLCKTTRNPYDYCGSGIDWKNHLLVHGTEHTTDIIKVCKTQAEFSYWGRYYSRLWNVVGAMDNYGNKIWANRIPETGGGGGGVVGKKRSPKVSLSNSVRWLNTEWADKTSAKISASKSAPDKKAKTRKQMLDMHASGFLAKKRKERLTDPQWVKEEKERRCRQSERQKKPVLIEGREYSCVKDAAVALGIEHATVRWRIRSKGKTFANWQYKT